MLATSLLERYRERCVYGETFDSHDFSLNTQVSGDQLEPRYV